jgi:hypothetical protein
LEPEHARHGGVLQIRLLPQPGDSGDGFPVFNDADCLGADFMRLAPQPIDCTDGNVDLGDTGAQAGAPISGCGDRLRVKIIPGGTACAGKLNVWVNE